MENITEKLEKVKRKLSSYEENKTIEDKKMRESIKEKCNLILKVNEEKRKSLNLKDGSPKVTEPEPSALPK
jgi:hypothetical protein